MAKTKKGTGYLYQRKLKGSTPGDPRFGSIWWCKYYVNGRAIQESTGTENESDARRVLNDRLGRVARGQPVLPRLDRIRYEEAAKDLRTHYETTGDRNTQEAGFRLKHLDAFFAGRRIASIGPADATKYAEQRQAEQASNATINRELAILNRMLRLAYENGKLLRLPIIRRLTENGPRQGFFGEVEFLALHEHLPEYLRPVARFAFVTGWRKREVLGLTWNRVDLERGTVTLDPGTTKNRDGRTVVLPEDLLAIVKRQWERTQALAEPVPWVFHQDGKPIRDFRRAWVSACKKANVPGRLFHDFRRTAVRNMVRAGIPDVVAMRISGHRTRSVFDRYNIVAEEDMREAARKLTGTFSGTPAESVLDAPRVNV